MKTNPLDALAMNGAVPTPSAVANFEETHRQFSRSLADVAPLVPEDQDPNVLFRNNWLSRGQVVTLTASTGVGKSSMTMQTAFCWSLGREFLARPLRPLRCAIIQAEDSERDVAEQIEGMRLGFVGGTTRDGKDVCGCGWTREDFERARHEILCPTCFIGLVGDEFIAKLKEFQHDMKCDMLFLNPLQGFFGGDISDQKEVSTWTRAGIDPIIKHPDCACGLFLVSHTTKFTSGDKQNRANVDDYGEYIGAGSHEWTDWTRAKFTFLKRAKSDKYFDFKAAKRGLRLGWTDDDANRTTNKVFRHSDGFIFWHEVTDEAELAAINEPATNAAKITEEDSASIAQRMVEWIRKHRAVSRTELNETNNDAFKGMGLTRRQRRAGGDIIKAHYKEYGMQYSRDGYGFAAGLRILDIQRQQQAEINAMRTRNAIADAERKAKEREIFAPKTETTENTEGGIPW